MTDLGDFLARLVERLEAAQVPYMLAGSVASTFHGMPRSTQDVDVVVELSSQSLSKLLSELPDDAYYVSADAARDALRRQAQFNIIDLATGWKADLIVRKSRPFSAEEFQRRVRAEVFGVGTWIASPEDTVLSKLEWSKRGGGSERQLRDVVGIVELRGAELDRAYIKKWAAALRVEDLWERALELAAG